MRFSRLPPAVVTMAAITAGCGWSPSGPAPTSTADCGPGPAPDAVTAEFALLPPGAWRDTSRGSTPDCRLHWVIVASGDAPDSPQQVLFFDGGEPVGSPTPEPRTYITVTAQGNHTANVQYQWLQDGDQACCPTGIGSARVTLEDGRLTVLDAIPGP
ncbi:LppP/LprE family lipoprotein [Mycolicibacterium pyrenivorans]|uniref:LppP/LprE family lipoprotein n=1 Tax=Mycolicibacterium pyrenivorans TaxID=187102 RepID=UPI0021F27FA0|nr:LppP/LprE family lipoprotein [Mycolicibacterium pyrenivorans]MCV7154561.1 LppP/LprE family lipoprotein [Mycolicibacterium pyrenivorans]